MSSLKVERLSKTFGTVRAGDSVSFEVRPGEIHGLLGPCGCIWPISTSTAPATSTAKRNYTAPALSSSNAVTGAANKNLKTPNPQP